MRSERVVLHLDSDVERHSLSERLRAMGWRVDQGSCENGTILITDGVAKAQALNADPSRTRPTIIMADEDSAVSGPAGPGFCLQLRRPVSEPTLLSAMQAALAYVEGERERMDLRARLRNAHAEAIEAHRAKSDFLANMSHEIRTPLGAVLGFSELLMEDGISDRERQAYMSTIRRNGQLLSALIDDILDLANVESGRLEVEALEFALSELVAEVVSVFEPQATAKGLPLLVEMPQGLPNMCKSDPRRLKQIFVNLIGNAIKFTNFGHVIIRLNGKPAGERRFILEIEFEDSGIGIPPKQTDVLFQPFTQVDASITRKFGGTGLGLVLSRQLARALGGDLKLSWSVVGGGSCFRLRIPVDLPKTTVIPPKATCAVKNGPLKGRRILVVDDSLDNQMLIGQTLLRLGAEIETANDGFQAVHKALAREFDVVLMDLQMPRLSGVEATRLLREKGYARPIVALTAQALKEDRTRCLDVGCTAYLTKPIQRTRLLEMLEELAPRTGSHASI